MTTICSSGYLLSSVDILVFNDYCLGTPREWLETAIKGLVNKATKTIIKDYQSQYVVGEIAPTTEEELALDIIDQDYFTNYNNTIYDLIEATRQNERDTESLSDGIELTDNGYAILSAFYKDIEQTAYDLLENKIALRKNAFIKDHYTSLEITVGSLLGSGLDSSITSITSEVDYKNREERDVEEI